jgi:hypothetical protein
LNLSAVFCSEFYLTQDHIDLKDLPLYRERLALSGLITSSPEALLTLPIR